MRKANGGSNGRVSRAFVLSGGASLGAVQVGMLQALFERGIAPDVIVGSSAGAINGAFIASREPTVQTARELGEVWQGLHRGTIFPLRPVTGLLGFVGRSSHVVPDGSLRRLITRHVGFDRLEDARVPLHVIVTDVLSGGEVRLSRGPAVDAVMASAAIPGVFAPVALDGRLLIDGGVCDNTPLSHAIELGADEIYVLPAGFACDRDTPPRGALAMLLHAMSVMLAQRLLVDIELYRERARLVVLPIPCPQHVLPIDFSHAAELVDCALAESRSFLDSLEANPLPGAPTSPAKRLEPHSHRSRKPSGAQSPSHVAKSRKPPATRKTSRG
ncbi:MAG: patatin [Solirubrobacterales bacterium]|nr:patatin [Solirubrobacterales bacterium]